MAAATPRPAISSLFMVLACNFPAENYLLLGPNHVIVVQALGRVVREVVPAQGAVRARTHAGEGVVPQVVRAAPLALVLVLHADRLVHDGLLTGEFWQLHLCICTRVSVGVLLFPQLCRVVQQELDQGLVPPIGKGGIGSGGECGHVVYQVSPKQLCGLGPPEPFQTSIANPTTIALLTVHRLLSEPP